MNLSDLSLTFVDSCCHTSEGLWASAKEIWEAYQEWSDGSSLRCMQRRDLLTRLSAYFSVDWNSNPQKVLGILLRDPEDWEWFNPEDLRKVYLISNGRHTKIGVSVDPPTRLEMLQVGSSAGLTLLHSWPGSFDQEAELHRRYSDKRVRGEWYDLDPLEITAIQKLSALVSL